MARWLLYGAYGFTGRLIVEEAVRRGHRPVLAGRDAARLAVLAQRFDLDWLALDLDYAERLHKTVDRYDLVLHAAGPFIRTSDPMIRACLAGRTHYIDITGEIPVFENTFANDAAARSRGISLMSGAGFDIVPTDCLAAHVAGQLPDATHLETAIAGSGDVTAGTVKSALGMLDSAPGGSLVRRDGQLVSQPLGRQSRRVRFSDGRERQVNPIPWGDLVTAYHTTGIPNITSFLAGPKLPGQGLATGLGARLMQREGLRRAAESAIDRTFKGPDEAARRSARSYLWARATNDAGQSVEGWLETVETYRFTALAAVRLAEKVLAERPVGAITPAGAFGADFVLELEGTTRATTAPAAAA